MSLGLSDPDDADAYDELLSQITVGGGLPAKPIIDIVLEVPDASHEPAYAGALEAGAGGGRP